jgi:hypothetical protein
MLLTLAADADFNQAPNDTSFAYDVKSESKLSCS